MKEIGKIKSVCMMSSEFGFKFGKPDNDWRQLSSLMAGGF